MSFLSQKEYLHLLKHSYRQMPLPNFLGRPLEEYVKLDEVNGLLQVDSPLRTMRLPPRNGLSKVRELRWKIFGTLLEALLLLMLWMLLQLSANSGKAQKVLVVALVLVLLEHALFSQIFSTVETTTKIITRLKALLLLGFFKEVNNGY